ncbi:MAG: dTMP kinase [Atopobiaceae bacterium]|jgi:dTMP kinase|nr:dTMP kinase [Atopobiaceae bacterium]MCH4119440.1 dTMP kinase [Atopobiaceae bacterium]MCI1318541.1 dTMP kinase [Atopobiaceae bacterium]MCI1389027.1 dTMP kinase [Atopobiaceae bacterium]MCI1431739.1 dTMP kinase [Atopobiaceae bacterium]
MGAARGILLTLEGADGMGKTTQAALLASDLVAAGADVVRLREPGGTELSERIRSVLLDPANAGMADECELLLYEAARAQLVRERIEPALASGMVVLCDRFYDSTFAYQACGRDIDERLVREANAIGSCGIVPDRTVVLDMDPARSLSRATAQGADRLEAEGLGFQARVREGFLRLAAEEPERVRVVDADGSVEEVHARLLAAVADVLAGMGIVLPQGEGQREGSVR